VIRAAVVRAAEGYEVELVDSGGSVLTIQGLTEEALLELAGTACVLAEEVDRKRARGGGRPPSLTA
jgi:hypothetical protein